MKTCTGCNKAKPLSEFRPRPERPVGVHSKCRDCERERARRYMTKRRAEDPAFLERQREATRRYGNRPENSERLHQRRQKADWKAKKKAYHSAYRETPEGKAKDRARQAVYRAIRSGKLIRPSTCSRCGEDPGVARDGRSLIRAHHHNGYDKVHWLDVEWVCVSCDMKKEGEERCAS